MFTCLQRWCAPLLCDHCSQSLASLTTEAAVFKGTSSLRPRKHRPARKKWRWHFFFFFKKVNGSCVILCHFLPLHKQVFPFLQQCCKHQAMARSNDATQSRPCFTGMYPAKLQTLNMEDSLQNFSSKGYKKKNLEQPFQFRGQCIHEETFAPVIMLPCHLMYGCRSFQVYRNTDIWVIKQNRFVLEVTCWSEQ